MATPRRNKVLVALAVLILFALLIALNWTAVSEGFKDGYDSVPK